MYRKIVWCYLIVLTLLDISLNTKLSAQGKSHGNGASVHESLMEGISLQQEWSSSESGSEGGGVGAGAGGGAGGAVLALQPAALSFGQRALAAAHALRVTITNTANETVHLASVAGTTPDFHASFFESKTLAPQANTSFSVVYLGRREGPAAAHLYIHTSKGVHKYPVSAVGVASDWRVWPLVGLRVPHNATLEPLLTLYNPTETTIQVQEVYSSGAWLGLSLPEGGEAAPRAAWTLPPHCARALVRLAVRLPPASPPEPRAAYIRIKGNMTGGGLVVGVEATPAPAGEFLSPVQLRLRTRGAGDAPDSVWIEAGSSSGAGAELAAGATGACRASAHPLPHSPPPPPTITQDKHTHNGGKADATGIHISLVRDEVEPMQELKPTAKITLDYAKMWAGYVSSLENGSASNGAGGGTGGAGGPQGGAYCTGWVTLGRAALPYSVRLLPGTMVLEPNELHFITCNVEEAVRARALVARNDFPEPLLLAHVHFPPEVLHLFHAESMAPMELKAGARGVVARLRLKEVGPGPLHTTLALHTNLSDYTLPLLLYEGTPTIEWEWPNSGDGVLRLGALGAGEGTARVVGARLRNRAAAPLCLTRLHARLPPPAHATFHLQDTRPQASCIPAGGSTRAVLSVRVSRGGGGGGSEVGGGGSEVGGAALAHTRHGAAAAAIRLTAHAGALTAAPVILSPAAPYMPGVGALVVESSMPLRMRVTSVTPHARDDRDPALTYIPGASPEIVEGRTTVGEVRLEPAAHCHPRCYCGLPPDTPDYAAWLSRSSPPGGGSEGAEGVDGGLAADAELQRKRYQLFQHTNINFTLQMHTTEVLGVLVTGTGSLVWPRVRVGAGGAGRAGLAGVGAAVPLRLLVGNPAARPLLLQPTLAVHTHALGGEPSEEQESCVGCVWSAQSFQLGEWRVTRGVAAPHPAHPRYLVLQGGAEVELTVTFTPSEPAELAAHLYLRNNLTVVERVLVRGRGALPSFELAGRRANSTSAIVVEVPSCGVEGARSLALRNTGRVPLRLRGWRVAGAPCGGRAFRLAPCSSLRLAPGESHTLQVWYAADWTVGRAQATLSVRVGAALARFSLAGLAPARLLPACAPAARRAPFEDQLRALALTLALLALIGGVGLGAADAERALRRHRSAREAPPAGPPLDLRAIGRTAPAPPVPAPPRPAPPPPPPPPAGLLPVARGGRRPRPAGRLALLGGGGGGAPTSPRAPPAAAPPGGRRVLLAGLLATAQRQLLVPEPSRGGGRQLRGGELVPLALALPPGVPLALPVPLPRDACAARPPAGTRPPAPARDQQRISSAAVERGGAPQRAQVGGARRRYLQQRRGAPATPRTPSPRARGPRCAPPRRARPLARPPRRRRARAPRPPAARPATRRAVGGQLERRRVARERGRTRRRCGRHGGGPPGPHRVGRATTARLALAVLLRQRAGVAPRAPLGPARAPRPPGARSVPTARARPRAQMERRGERRRLPLAGVAVGLVRGAAGAGRRVAVGRGRRSPRAPSRLPPPAAPARVLRPAAGASVRPLPVAGVDLDAGGAGLATGLALPAPRGRGGPRHAPPAPRGPPGGRLVAPPGSERGGALVMSCAARALPSPLLLLYIFYILK